MATPKGPRTVVRFDGRSALWQTVGSWGTLKGQRTVVLFVRLAAADENATRQEGSRQGVLFDGSTRVGSTPAEWNNGVWKTSAKVTSSGAPGKWQVLTFVFGADATPTGGLILGANVATQRALECDVAEVLIYPRALDEQEQRSVADYLRDKWGAPTELPAAQQPQPLRRPDDPRLFWKTLRKQGDDGVHTYRIPGLATTPKGTLIAVFDARNKGGADLPGDIDVAMMRSVDDGETWSPLRRIIDFDAAAPGTQGNGVGDPAILVDRQTGVIFVVALWSKGPRAWHGSGPGLTPDETGQLVLVKSADDGLTWSTQVSITPQVKDPAWRLCFNGPGNGIQLRDGTLVFPAQFKASREARGEGAAAVVPHSCFIASRDGGETWKIAPAAIPDGVPTSECAVAELNDGALLLSMRNEARSGRRAWARWEWRGDLWQGKWSEPWFDLPDPTCMASLIRHSSGKLIFSNPNHSQRRVALTIRTSRDDGRSWSAGRLIDPSGSMYSCLTVLRDGRVGMIYESVDEAGLVFVRFPLDWLEENDHASPPPAVRPDRSNGGATPAAGIATGLAGARVAALALAPLVATSAVQAAERRPNVVFILADDLGWSDTTLYGTTKYYRTPNLERLAKRGMLFTRAYSASPLCSPTRSAILTGLSPARTGITTPNGHVPQVVLEATVARSAPPNVQAIQPSSVSRLKTEYRTLAEALRDAGYVTGHFGKWHLGAEPYSPLQHGFDVDIPHHPGPGPAGSYVAPWKFKNFPESSPGEHIEDRMAKEAVAWIERHRDRPFFLNYWQFSVHAPFDAKRELVEKHRVRVNPDDPQRSPTYAAMVESMDDAVGKLLDALDRLELSDQTVVIFTADNGGNMYSDVDGVVPTSNRPLRGGKATMFEGGTRVPGVIAWPGVTQPGSRSDVMIQSEDYYPTLLAGLGIAPADGQRFDGENILPALKGGELERTVLFQYFPHSPPVPDWLPPSVSAHRADGWKLLRLFYAGESGAHRHLLFNVREDLGETRNRAAEHPEIVRELDARIEQFLVDTKAVTPRPNPAFDPKQYRPEDEGQPTPRKKTANKKAANKKAAADKAAADKAAAKPNTEPAATSGDDPLLGWKARGCRASIKDGVLTVQELTDASFLGFAAGRHGGPATVRFRIKSSGGESHVDWLPDGPGTEAQRAKYAIQPDVDWQEIAVKLPAGSRLGVVRVYLPSGAKSAEIDWIEITSRDNSQTTRTNF